MPDFHSLEIKFRQFILSDVAGNIGLGDDAYLDQLGDPSLEYQASRTAEAKALIAKLEATSSDDAEQRLDLELMALKLKKDVFFDELTQHGQPQRRRMPNGVGGISAGVFQLFINDEREPYPRLDNILQRLLQAPDYLAKEAAVITEPITRWRDTELAQGEGIPDLLQTIVEWATQQGYPQLGALNEAVKHCNRALADYLDDLKSRKTIDGFAIGEEKVKELLALRQISQSPTELAKMAADFMGETQQLLASLRERLCEKYQLPASTSEVELHEFLNQHFAAKLKAGKIDSVLDYYTDQIDKIEAFIDDKKLFEIPEQQSMKIMQTPSFLEPVIPAGAMFPPLALREGRKTSLVYLTLKEDQLAEHTELGIPVMMIHEGIPGHHLQFASAAQHPSLVRRIFNAQEHSEGWTTMLEDYMLDVGYIGEELVDEVRFIAKRDISRLVARVGIDLYFMTSNKDYLQVGLDLDFDSDDVFVNAAKLLKEATGFTDGRVQAELNWYCSEQSYPLSYLTGNRLVWQLKQEIQAANKKGLTPLALDQAFHDIYLSSGCMPVASLRQVFCQRGYL
ncbi:uncharacterized protein (DUF885 family) [Sinobacterium caligoides]|uniref:Uncharacterized protein (DUF885 family) n=1 Tax=Sinobacterium caligoides TaxID=933926 RepID=A0A3N2DKL4_9GAMM|nr:DUF885 family protein [Sinobacterium caligoides]ROS00229.1 uncharacterized protein (DUF885 family) [Sinobacterium caligoides]